LNPLPSFYCIEFDSSRFCSWTHFMVSQLIMGLYRFNGFCRFINDLLQPVMESGDEIGSDKCSSIV
jgi:hypothetical protein